MKAAIGLEMRGTRPSPPERLHIHLANTTGLIIQAPKVNQSFIIRIYNSEKDVA